MRHKVLNQAGDTIVEVMIAIIIVGTMLSAAYAIANRNLHVGRQAQERGEALKLVEGQIELLKALGKDATLGPQIFATPAVTFCIAVPALTVQTGFSYVPDTTTLDAADINSGYPAGCISATGLYHLSVRQTDTTTHTFTILARWFRSGGTGREELKMSYRMSP